MEFRVSCPQCKTALKVPSNSAGKHARCPVCRTKFEIPKLGDLVEDTISNWIDEDVEQEKTEEQDRWDTMAKMSAAERAKAKAAGAAQEQQQPAAPDVGLSNTPIARRADEGGRSAPRPIPRAPIGDVASEAAAAPSASRPSAAVPSATRPSPAPAVTPEPPARSDEVPVPSAPRPRAPTSSTGDAEPGAFPYELEPTSARPYMIVRACTQEGVKLAFDSRWLEHPGFRLSMPVRCAFSNSNRLEDLIARPLAFTDRSQAAVRSARDVEVPKEQRMSSGMTPEQIIELMGKLEWLPAPFNTPMPYYVEQAQSRQSVQCSTHTRPDGGITCEVMIPNGQYALEWLGNVNGVCGREYPLLRRGVTMMFNEAWRSLPDEARRRISMWCQFDIGESFKTYLCDADFSKSDYGLGGLAITDRRIVYCKYHRKGAIDLHADSLLHVQTEGDFLNLTHVQSEARSKLVKLHLTDLPVLIKSLAGSPGLKLQIG